MNNRNLESSMRMAGRRFGKNTLCTILTGKQLMEFIAKNSLLPDGFFITDEQYGLSAVRNRVLCVPQYDYLELRKELDNYGIGTDAGPPTETNNTNSGLSQLERRLRTAEALITLLKQTMIVVLITNPRPRMSDLDLLDVLIDSVDVMGSITGTLVPKSNMKDPNGNLNWNK